MTKTIQSLSRKPHHILAIIFATFLITVSSGVMAQANGGASPIGSDGGNGSYSGPGNPGATPSTLTYFGNDAGGGGGGSGVTGGAGGAGYGVGGATAGTGGAAGGVSGTGGSGGPGGPGGLTFATGGGGGGGGGGSGLVVTTTSTNSSIIIGGAGGAGGTGFFGGGGGGGGTGVIVDGPVVFTNTGDINGGAGGAGGVSTFDASNYNGSDGQSGVGVGLINNASVINSGAIYVSGGGVGIDVYGNSSITNEAAGIISSINGPGIFIRNSSTIISLINDGEIISLNSNPIVSYGAIINLTNSRTGRIISGNYAQAVYSDSSSTIANFTNAGEISSPTTGNGVQLAGTVGTFENTATGVISTADSWAFQNGYFGTITNFINAGTIRSINDANQSIDYQYAFQNTYGSTIINFANSATGTISSINGNALKNSGGGIIRNFTNAGTISSINGNAIYNEGTITTLTNTGSITGGSYGISTYLGRPAGFYDPSDLGDPPAGTITTLNNAQGGNSATPARTALTYAGVLPTNYNIIINSTSSYGQLAVTNGTGAMAFGINTGSTVAAGTYASVFSGMLEANISTSTRAGSYGSFTWTLAPRTPGGTLWDLVFASSNLGNITSPTSNLSNLGAGFNSVFDGGKLVVDSDRTVTNAFTIKPTSGAIDQSGKTATFAGQFTDDTTGAGKLTIVNSGAKTGAVILSGNNTYSGGTEVQSGATLQIASNQAIGTGTLTLKGDSTTAATFKPAADNLVVSNRVAIATQGAIDQSGKTSTFTGVFTDDTTGAGKLVIINSGENQGAVVLAANNSYSGGTQVQAGATLQIGSASAIGTGTLELVGTATTSANIVLTTSMTISNRIQVEGDPTITVAAGQTGTFTSTIDDLSYPGEIVIGASPGNAGGGTVVFTAVNTYSGDTKVDAGNTLVLSGNGSIALSGTGAGWTGVINNGTFNIAPATSNTVTLGANYTQSSTGTLGMNWYQKLSIAGTASLAGTLTLFNSNSSTFSLGRYTLITANGGRSGAFGTLDATNLSSNYSYTLSYDANDTYLIIAPSKDYTQQSLVNTAQVLQGTFALQNSILNSSLGYDCNLFGPNGICISTGGRNTTVQAEGINNTSALLIAAYKVMPKIRIGAYADQNLSTQAPGTVKLGNNTPLLGLFAAWNENPNGTGLEVKASASYGQKSATVTRSTVVTSEPGSGSSNLTTQGAQIVAKYGFAVTPSTILSPYLGVRYSQSNMGGYTEGTSTSVTAPLTYQALNTNATTLLAGASISHQLNPKTTIFASAGVESDTNTSNGSYSATSPNIPGLTSINFNPTAVNTRPTATVGAYYDLEKNQRLGIVGGYAQTPYQAVSTTSVMATYTIGF